MCRLVQLYAMGVCIWVSDAKIASSMQGKDDKIGYFRAHDPRSRFPIMLPKNNSLLTLVSPVRGIHHSVPAPNDDGPSRVFQVLPRHKCKQVRNAE